MSSYENLMDIAQSLLDLASVELEYINEKIVEDERLKTFVEEKKSFRKRFDTEIFKANLTIDEKANLKSILIEINKIEGKIGDRYQLRVDSLKKSMGNINKEKKLKEAYAKSGMDFTSDLK